MAGSRRRGRPVRLANGDLSEHAHQRRVTALLRFYDWRVFHAPAGGKDGRVDREQIGAGFPDLVAVRPPRLLFAELKPTKGAPRVTVAAAEARPPGYRHRDLTDDQAAWLMALEDVEANVAEAVATAEATAGAYSRGDGPSVEVYLWRPDDLEDVARIVGDGNAYRLEAALAYVRGLAS